jgi:hypothetical protein
MILLTDHVDPVLLAGWLEKEPALESAIVKATAERSMGLSDASASDRKDQPETVGEEPSGDIDGADIDGAGAGQVNAVESPSLTTTQTRQGNDDGFTVV